MATAPKAPESASDKKKRMRSPAYPYVNLEMAIKRAKEFYDKEGRNAAPLKVAVKHWGYEEKSSGGLQTAAALISFGLMQDEGTGDKRKLKLTQNALSILLDERPNSEARAQAIRTAALTPKIHQQIWARYGSSQVSEASIKHMLILELDPPFNPNTAETVIKEYRDTIAFAKPNASDTVPLADGDLGAESEEIPSDPPENTPPKLDFSGFPDFKPRGDAKGAKMRQDIFSLTEGEAVIRWPTPLSADSIADLDEWLDLVKRKIKRSLSETKTEPAQE